MSLSDLLASREDTQSINKKCELALAYIRVSHERSAEKNISPETQRHRIEAYAKERGYEIVKWYQDLGISAFRDDELRIEWKQMLNDAKESSETSLIIVWRYDRFSRGDDAQVIQRELLKSGVRIESAEEGYFDPDSETGAIMMPLTWSINRLYSIKLRNMVIPNMKTNFETRDPGTGWAYKNGGWAQFGFKKHRIKVGRSTKSTDIFKVVWLLDDRQIGGKHVWEWAHKMLVEWRLKECLGYDSIAARLTNAGVPTPSGKSAWSASSIQAILGEWDRLYQYTGVAFWNREDCADRGNRKRRDTSEWVVVENAHPPIISSEEANAIWEMVANKKRQKSAKAGSGSRYSLSGGLIKCKHCGANYAGVNKPAGDYYVCGSHIYRRGAGCANSWYIPRREVEQLVFDKLLKRIPASEAGLKKCADKVNAILQEEQDCYAKTATERQSKISALEKQSKNLTKAIAGAGPITDLVDSLKKTSAALERLKKLNNLDIPKRVTLDEIKNVREKLASGAQSADDSTRQRILKQFVVELVADAEKKMLEGTLMDPRALFLGSTVNETHSSSEIGSYMAVPRGVEPLSRP